MVTFRVPDMTCGDCAATIAKAIAAEDAGARVEFDIAAHLVRVAPAAATPAELEDAIREAGYSPAQASGCGCGCGPAKAVDLAQAPAGANGGCCA